MPNEDINTSDDQSIPDEPEESEEELPDEESER